jgi:tetratricopeptide (TPR) repeat protein
MTTAQQKIAPEPRDVLSGLLEHKQKRRWVEIASAADCIPADLSGHWLRIADEVAFALGQLRRTDEAAALFERAFAAEPTHRRASALAYLYYSALLGGRGPGKKNAGPCRDREADLRAFTRWMHEALERDPGSIKDLYRLGVFEAQVQSCHDAPALRAFERAVDLYRVLPGDVRERRHDLFKPYVKCLYAGARSALRLGRLQSARKLIFACIREDERTDHVEPVHKLLMAGKVCAAQGQLDHAERAFRLALDARGPGSRDYVYSALAGLAARAGRFDEAAAWIEQHLPPHRRPASIWRLLGDIRRAAGKNEEARTAYENALRRDRVGRHLTLVRLGQLHLEAERNDRAERAFEEANTFRRRRYLSDHVPALQGLLAVARVRGDARRVAELQRAITACEKKHYPEQEKGGWEAEAEAKRAEGDRKEDGA